MHNTKPCPFCAEDIKVAAIKCKHCGEMLAQEAKSTTGPRKPPALGGSAPSTSAPSGSTAEAPKPRSSSANSLAALLFAVGIAVFAYAIAMDTTVSTGMGRVANIHLGQQQTTYLIVGALAIAGGFGVVASAKK